MTSPRPNLNPYIASEFEPRFRQTEIFAQLSQDFDDIDFGWHFDLDACGPVLHGLSPHPTPRQTYAVGENIALRFHQRARSRFSAVAFYYLEYLTNRDPETIYDLGCGWNIFKRYIPNVVGIGADPPGSAWYYADQYGRVDDAYVSANQDFFESVFSINALHFVPLYTLRARVLQFISMVKPGGAGYLALNIQRMLEKDPSFDSQSNSQIEEYVRCQLNDLPCDVPVFDLDLTHMRDRYRIMHLADLEGNLRLVVTK